MGEKKIIKRIGVLSYAKISAIIGAIAGLIMIILTLVLGLIITSLTGANTMTQDLRVWDIVLMPIEFAILGFIAGIIGAWLYNLIAKWVGGIELEFEK